MTSAGSGDRYPGQDQRRNTRDQPGQGEPVHYREDHPKCHSHDGDCSKEQPPGSATARPGAAFVELRHVHTISPSVQPCEQNPILSGRSSPYAPFSTGVVKARSSAMSGSSHRPGSGTAYGDAAGQRWCRGGRCPYRPSGGASGDGASNGDAICLTSFVVRRQRLRQRGVHVRGPRVPWIEHAERPFPARPRWPSQVILHR